MIIKKFIIITLCYIYLIILFFFKYCFLLRDRVIIMEKENIYIIFINYLLIFVFIYFIIIYYNYIYITNIIIIIYFLFILFFYNVIIEYKIIKFLFSIFESLRYIIIYNDISTRILNSFIFRLCNKYIFLTIISILLINNIIINNTLYKIKFIKFIKFKILIFIIDINNILLLFFCINYLEKLSIIYLFKNNIYKLNKKILKKKNFYFEKFISNIILNLKKNKEPLKYIKNEKIVKISDISQFFFFLCQNNDGTRRIIFTYPYDLSYFLEKINKNFINFSFNNIYYINNKIYKKNIIFFNLNFIKIFSNKIRLYNNIKSYLFNKYYRVIIKSILIINKNNFVNNIHIFLHKKIKKNINNIFKKYKIYKKIENINEIIYENYEIRSRKYKRIKIFTELLKNFNYSVKKNINEIYLIKFFKQLDFCRDIVKGSMRIKRRKINLYKLIHLNINSIFFLLNKKIKINIWYYIYNKKNKINIEKEKLWDIFPITQTIISLILLVQSIIRKYILLPFLIIIKNIIYIVTFRYPQWKEDFYKWNKEKHIKCTYNKIQLSEKEFPKNWLIEGIQIKILYPFYFKSYDKNIICFLTIWGTLECKYSKKKYNINKNNIYLIMFKYIFKLKFLFKNIFKYYNKKEIKIIINNNNKYNNINFLNQILFFKKIKNDIIYIKKTTNINLKKKLFLNFIFIKYIYINFFFKLVIIYNNKVLLYIKFKNNINIIYEKLFKMNIYKLSELYKFIIYKKLFIIKNKNINNIYNYNIIKFYEFNKLLYKYINYKNILNLKIYKYNLNIKKLNKNINLFEKIIYKNSIKMYILYFKYFNKNNNINELNRIFKYIIIQIKLNYFINQKIDNNIKIYCLFLNLIDKYLILSFIKKKYININIIIKFKNLNVHKLIEKNILIIKLFRLFENNKYNRFFMIYQYIINIYIYKYNKIYLYSENNISYRYCKQLRILIYFNNLLFFKNILKFNKIKNKSNKFNLYIYINYKFEDLIYINKYFFIIKKYLIKL
uniref:Ycf1 n=1 Tax=Ombrophytum subterraneum TaxID=50155 RepID=A0A8E7IXE1_9MAGN|nr:Ycf1 [Ombrophytum subterraneum]